MRKIITLGETVLDIILYNFSPKAGNPGGSMLNTSVTLGRLGLPVFFVSELGDDKIALFVLSFLRENGIHTQYIECYNGRKSAIALAFLDEKKSASYSFYKDYPSKRFAFDFPVVQKGDVLLFGSSLSLNGDLSERIFSYVKNAYDNGATVIYDPNYRPGSGTDVRTHQNIIEKYLPYVSIVKASNDDCCHLWGATSGKEAFAYLHARGCNALFYTKGDCGSDLYLQDFFSSVQAKPLARLVSTVGAGDNYSAGIIYSLFKYCAKDVYVSLRQYHNEILEVATAFSAAVCESNENYISNDFACKYLF